MENNEEEAIKRLLESQYVGVLPPQHLKASIMRTIDFLKTLKELSLLYTKVPLYVLKQWKIKGAGK